MKDARNEFSEILKSVDAIWKIHPHLQADLFLILAYTMDDPEKYFGSFLKVCHALIDVYRKPLPTKRDIQWDEQYMTFLQEFVEEKQNDEIMDQLEKQYGSVSIDEGEVIANQLVERYQEEKEVNDHIKVVINDPNLSVENKAKILFYTEHGINSTVYLEFLTLLMENAAEKLIQDGESRLIKIFNQYADYHNILRIELNPFDKMINIMRRNNDGIRSEIRLEIKNILKNELELLRLAEANHLEKKEVIATLKNLSAYIKDYGSSYGIEPTHLLDDESVKHCLDTLREYPLSLLIKRINGDSEITTKNIIDEIENILNDPFEIYRISQKNVRLPQPMTTDQLKDKFLAMIEILRDNPNSIGLVLGMLTLDNHCVPKNSKPLEFTTFSDFKEIFHRLIKNPNDIYRAINSLPQTTRRTFFQQLFAGAIQDRAERIRLFSSYSQFAEVSGLCSLGRADQDRLTYEIIQNKAERQQLIDSYSMLKTILGNIKAENIQSEIVSRVLSEVIKDSVSNPETFKRWFKTPADFNQAKQDFPDHPVFSLDTLEDAIEYVSAMKDKKDIETAARVMSMENKEGRFFKPPREVRTLILQHLSDENSPLNIERARVVVTSTEQTKKWEKLMSISPEELREKLKNSDDKYKEEVRETLASAQSDIVASQDKKFPIREGLSEHIDSLISVLDDANNKDLLGG